MRRIVLSPALAAAFFAALSSASGDSIELREIRELRQIVEQQSKQIETLTQRVSKLSEQLDRQKPGAQASGTAASEGAGSAPGSAPSTAAAASTLPGAPTVEPETRRAEAAPKHTVAKGETLTSIAKVYNVTVSDLLKLNKIENDRKLQIGQTLTIPAPKPTETPAEKKETP